MSDLTKLKEVLNNQSERGKDPAAYGESEYRISKGDSGQVLSVDSQCIAFVFTPRGRFLGMYNWK